MTPQQIKDTLLEFWDSFQETQETEYADYRQQQAAEQQVLNEYAAKFEATQ